VPVPQTDTGQVSLPILRLTTSQRDVFLLNSRLGHFTAAFFSSPRRWFTYSRHPFSRSYGVILPSSLTRAHSSTLGYSPHLPVSVCGTDTLESPLEVFPGGRINVSLWAKPSHSRLGVNGNPDFPGLPAYLLRPSKPAEG